MPRPLGLDILGWSAPSVALNWRLPSHLISSYLRLFSFSTLVSFRRQLDKALFLENLQSCSIASYSHLSLAILIELCSKVPTKSLLDTLVGSSSIGALSLSDSSSLFLTKWHSAKVALNHQLIWLRGYSHMKLKVVLLGKERKQAWQNELARNRIEKASLYEASCFFSNNNNNSPLVYSSSIYQAEWKSR